MTANIVTWLQERTALSILSEEVLEAIAPKLQSTSIEPNQTIIEEGETPNRLYILLSGHLESTSNSSLTVNLLPGSALNLYSLVLHQGASYTVKTLSDAQFWWMSAAEFGELLKQYPEIVRVYSQQLAGQVQTLASQLNFEQERSTILRPYLVTKAKRGVVGRSRYAVRLRAQIQTAAQNRESVLIFGEPGLEKDNLAALIHFSSAFRRQPIVQVDCSKVQTSGAELFGRKNGKPGLIEALGEGTLVLNNIQELPPELIEPVANLIKTNTYTPVSRPNEPVEPKTSQTRLILISEKTIAPINSLVGMTIKVPPLRVRKADLADQANYYISLICRAGGIRKPRITPEAIRKLQAYDFPNNLRELENLIQRAIVQLQGCQQITEEIIWPSQTQKKQFRLNLLNAYPRLRQLLRSRWWPDRINYGFTLVFFALVVAVLFIGPQTRDRNFALNLFWAWWWPLILIGFPFVGRVWCAFCPFMIYGEVTQKLSLWLFPRQLKRWPRQTADKWGGWFLWGLFALILLWEELWELENTAYLSACLLLLITAGAMIFSAIFERRFWCRYLCPIGGMNGMFAKLSMTELRAQQGTCAAECTTYQCYKGGPAKGEGMATDGCPLYSHPAQLEDNRDCVLCMTCLKACPHRSVELNLRPPGIELWTNHIARSYEVALLFLLLGAVLLHRLPEISQQYHWNLNLTSFPVHLAVACLVLFLPVALPLLADRVTRLINRWQNKYQPRRWLELAYGYLPLTLAANLAHFLRLGLGEGGQILPLTFATFNLDGAGLPVIVADPAVIAFLQGTVLVFGLLTSIILTQKIARQPLTYLWPQHLCLILFTVVFWQITVGW